ncbi:MAG: SDR family NAD(P)-dependent oxidoreductase [Dehalococcoidales bacterium]
MYRFQGKVALVTGAARLRGIGHSTAIRFAREGANVVVNGRYRPPEEFPEEEKLEAWKGLDSVVAEIEAQGVKGLGITADISDRKQVQDMVDKTIAEFGRIDFLVANAGINIRKPFLEFREEDWHQVLAVNLSGVFFCCQAVARKMVEQGEGGAIVNVSSRAGKMGIANYAAYCASKFGVNGLTQVLAIELGPHNIRVNAVCPGRTITNIVFADKVWKVARDKGVDIMEASKEVYSDWVPVTPLRRAALPEEIANTIVFLCSEEASFITGQSINVNGGRLTAH